MIELFTICLQQQQQHSVRELHACQVILFEVLMNGVNKVSTISRRLSHEEVFEAHEIIIETS